MMRPNSYRDLYVWRKAMLLAREGYALSRRLPPNEVHALSAQLRRAVVSVPANIAEGNGRSSLRSYLLHLHIARGSLHEVETLVLVAIAAGLVSPSHAEPVLALASETSRLLTRLVKALRAKMDGRGAKG